MRSQDTIQREKKYSILRIEAGYDVLHGTYDTYEEAAARRDRLVETAAHNGNRFLIWPRFVEQPHHNAKVSA